MERHDLAGLIELAFILGLLLWFAVTQIRFPPKGKRRRKEGTGTSGTDETPPTQG